MQGEYLGAKGVSSEVWPFDTRLVTKTSLGHKGYYDVVWGVFRPISTTMQEGLHSMQHASTLLSGETLRFHGDSFFTIGGKGSSFVVDRDPVLINGQWYLDGGDSYIVADHLGVRYKDGRLFVSYSPGITYRETGLPQILCGTRPVVLHCSEQSLDIEELFDMSMVRRSMGMEVLNCGDEGLVELQRGDAIVLLGANKAVVLVYIEEPGRFPILARQAYQSPPTDLRFPSVLHEIWWDLTCLRVGELVPER